MNFRGANFSVRPVAEPQSIDRDYQSDSPEFCHLACPVLILFSLNSGCLLYIYVASFGLREVMNLVNFFYDLIGRAAHTNSIRLCLAALIFMAMPTYAQITNEVTSEFVVSGASQMYAGSMGTAPFDIDGQSRILVAWHKSPVPGGGFESNDEIIPPLDFQTGVFVSTYSNTGEVLRKIIRVDEPESEGWPMGAILAADAQGRFVVVWRHARFQDEEKDHLVLSLWMRAFDAAGLPLTNAEKLADDTDTLPSIDMAPSGAFVIVLGRIEPEDDMNFASEPPQFWSFDADFQATSLMPHPVEIPMRNEDLYSLSSAVSLNDNGILAIAYIDSTIYSFRRVRHLRLRTMTADGLAMSEPIEIESNTVWGLDIEWLDDETFVASWMDRPMSTPVAGKWQVFNINGQAVSQLFKSELAVGQGGILRVSDTEFVVTWSTESGPILIPSTHIEQMEEIPLNIHNDVLPGSFIDHSVIESVSYPLVVDWANEDNLVAVWMNKRDHREQVRAEIVRFQPEDNMTTFESEVLGPCVEDRTATVQLSWSSEVDYVEIYVAGPPADKLFARVNGSGSILTGLWATRGMAFKLVDLETGKTLATAKANPSSTTCPLSPVITDAEIIEVCDPHEIASTEILWDVTGTSLSSVDVRVNGVNGKLFARGGQLGSALTGEWLRNDTVFYLLKAYTAELLGTASSEFQQVTCP